MKQALAIDMDGVVISNDRAWAQYYNDHRVVHDHAQEAGVPTDWDYFANICSKCFSACVHSHKLMMQCDLMPGAREGLVALSQHFTLHLISHRAPHMAPVATTLLAQHGVGGLFYTTDWSWGPKRQRCEELGAFALVDDAPKNILALEGSYVTPIIFDHAYNRHLPQPRAKSWIDVVALAHHAAWARRSFGLMQV